MSQKKRTAPQPKPKFNWLLAAVIFAVSTSAAFFFLHSKRGGRAIEEVPTAAGTKAPRLSAAEKDKEIFSSYAGSESCRECHRDAYDKFKDSHHALAEQKIDPEKVKVFFEPPRKITHGTQTSEATRVSDRFILTSADLSGGTKDFSLSRIIGVKPLQQFLVGYPDGRFQTTELAIDPAKGDWFDVFGNEDRRPGEWGHWTGRGMVWNSMCASCHNTRLRKNYDPGTDTYATSMVENRVGCEACHGPMGQHDQWQRKFGKGTLKDPTIKKPTRDQIVDTCGTCHSRRAELTGDFVPGDKFFDHFALTIPDETDIYYPDGQVRDEDYEFASFLSSKMHAAGVRCIDCHEPHSAKIRLPGNALCMTCHGAPIAPAPKIDASHSHHKSGERGDNCVDCHMPLTTYMQRHERRDHGFTIPDPLLTKQLNIPNACNRCHTDRSADWSIEAVEKWYGKKMERFTRHRAQVIADVRTDGKDAHQRLLALLKEEKHSYWRAVETGLLKHWADDPQTTAALLGGLANTNELVRLMAIRSLQSTSQLSPATQNALERMLKDPIRSVRIEAAWALHTTIDTNSSVGRELLQYLEQNLDQPSGQLQFGTFLLDRNETAAALTHLQTAVKWDTNSAPLHHAYAVALSMTGNSQEAVRSMREACRLAPREPEYHFKLALALNEVGKLDEAVPEFEKAVEIAPQFLQAWYNLGLAYAALHKTDLALEKIAKAESLNPGSAQYPYARATILAQASRFEEARMAAQRALDLRPDYEPAAALLQQLQSSPTSRP